MQTEIDDVLKEYSGLSYDSDTNMFSGLFYVEEDDFYLIEVDISNYPNSFPIVHEVGERIPKTMDRHIYSNTKSCCFTTRAMSRILLKTELNNLLDFFDKIMKPYFQNNSYYEIHRKYFGEEYSHGSLGIYEGYKDILGIDNIRLIALTMSNWVIKGKLGIHDRCYCESGVSLKKCNSGDHDRRYRLFRKIGKEIVRNDLLNLINLLSTKE